MITLVNARHLNYRQPKGLENFTLCVLQGIAEAGGQLVIDARPGDVEYLHERFRDHPSVGIIRDPAVAFFQSNSARARPLRLIGRLANRLLQSFDERLDQPRARWAK